MDATKIPLTFRIYRGETLVRTETLAQPVIKVGKLASSHLRLDDEQVSRMHAVIEVGADGVITIIDIGSQKGTFVNGQRVNKARLQPGDAITFGDTRVELARDDAAEVTAEILVRAAAPPPPVPAAAARAAAAPAPHVEASFGADAASAGPRAIEVAAMLDDSVVAVKHLSDPRGGRVRAATKALFAGGALMLALSVLAFAHGVGVARDNQRALRRWVEVENRSAADFRPVRLSPAWDALAFLGLGLGLAGVTWGLGRLPGERRSPHFRIGRARGVEFPTDSAPAESFPLVSSNGQDFVFAWAEGMRGEMAVGGQVTPLAQLPRELPIPLGARIRVESGASTFLISSVAAPPRQRLTPMTALQGAVAAFFLGSALVHAGLLGVLYAMPPDGKQYVTDPLDLSKRYVSVSAKPQETPKNEVEPAHGGGREGGDDQGRASTKAPGEEGRMGSETSKNRRGLYRLEKTADREMMARADAVEYSRNAGVLGVLRSPNGMMKSLVGTDPSTSGWDERTVYGGLDGDMEGDMFGNPYARGVRGNGTGGGCTLAPEDCGLIGVADGPTGGKIGWDKTGDGYTFKGTCKDGNCGPGGPRRSPGAPPATIGTVRAKGDLDKSIIRRYVKQHLAEIRHCYEKQLVVRPDLAGTVDAQFIINGNGVVTQVSARGLGDRTVESCVAGIIGAIQFPRPDGGGIVQVTSYPFILRPSGH